MRDGDGPIFDPFASCVFAMLDMTVTFCGEIVAPLDACLVVVEERGRLLSIVDGVTSGGEMLDHVANIDSKTRTHVGSANLHLAGAERRAFLTVSFPSDRSARAENDGTTHAAEFE